MSNHVFVSRFERDQSYHMLADCNLLSPLSSLKKGFANMGWSAIAMSFAFLDWICLTKMSPVYEQITFLVNSYASSGCSLFSALKNIQLSNDAKLPTPRTETVKGCLQKRRFDLKVYNLMAQLRENVEAQLMQLHCHLSFQCVLTAAS